MIHIIDYDMGNLRSVQKAFEAIGVPATICQKASELQAADKLVLPGVGAFRDAIAALRQRDMIQPILDHVAQSKPMLGICLGMQLLFDRSYEDGDYEGLGIIPGEVIKFQDQPGLKIPHMGWNQLELQNPSPLLNDIPEHAHFYFVHSYFVSPTDPNVITATSTHGQKFTAVIRQGNLFATQFHPEKSQTYGLKLLQNFAQV
jgi:glutamine amidotransferase